MVAKKFYKAAFKFLMLLVMLANMPSGLFAVAVKSGQNIYDYADSMIYRDLGNREAVTVYGTNQPELRIMNIPTEIVIEEARYGRYKNKVTSIQGICYVTEGSIHYYPWLLQSVNIPGTVTLIEEGVFRPYSGYEKNLSNKTPYDGTIPALTKINVDPDNPNYATVDGVLYNKDKSVLIAFPPGKTEFNIPATVTEIANYAFSRCMNLKSLVIPNSVTRIGSRAFEDCMNLETVTLPESLTSIDDYAFAGCSNLKSMVIPNSVTSIGSYVFEDCTNLETIALPESVAIGNYAFMNCKSLSSMNFLGTLASIGDYAFSGCTGLKSIYVPVAKVGAFLFDGCTNLESVTLPETVTSIGHGAFSNCVSLVSIDFPATLTSIGYDIFLGCSSLKKINVAPGNGSFADVDGVLYDKDLHQLLICPRAATGEYAIPSSVAIIGTRAFSGCASLTSVTIPASVEMIKEDAFRGCASLSEITLPASVYYIGENAFLNCASLLTIRSMRMRPPETGSGAFSNVPIEARVYVPKRTVPYYLQSKAWSGFYYYFEVEEWVTGISDITADSGNTPQDVYTPQGVCIRRNATDADIEALPEGIYIIGGKKVYVK